MPRYLPSLPADPCDPAGRPIRALLTGGKPRLYSLGADMSDQAGCEAADEPSGKGGDVVFYLDSADRATGCDATPRG